jgi:hypothetical protein
MKISDIFSLNRVQFFRNQIIFIDHSSQDCGIRFFSFSVDKFSLLWIIYHILKIVILFKCKKYIKALSVVKQGLIKCANKPCSKQNNPIQTNRHFSLQANDRDYIYFQFPLRSVLKL